MRARCGAGRGVRVSRLTSAGGAGRRAQHARERPRHLAILLFHGPVSFALVMMATLVLCLRPWSQARARRLATGWTSDHGTKRHAAPGFRRHPDLRTSSATITVLYLVSAAVVSVMVRRDAGCLAMRRDRSPASRCVVPEGEHPLPAVAGAAGRSEVEHREGLLTPVGRRENVRATDAAA